MSEEHTNILSTRSVEELNGANSLGSGSTNIESKVQELHLSSVR